MSSPAAPAGNILRRFRRNHRGSAVVEFALVAPIFFGLLFAIIELALVLCSVAVLTKRAPFWYSGIAIGLIGAAVGLSGLLVH